MSHSVLHSDKMNDLLVFKRLLVRGWQGRYYGLGDCVTYLTNDNKTIAEVHYDEHRKLILYVYWWL